MLVSVVGSALGALTLLHTPEQQFAALVPWLLLAATLVLTFGRRLSGVRWRVAEKEAPEHTPPTTNHQPLTTIFQLIIAFYGGYFGAGIGILMLASLQFYRLQDIHQMNAVKTVLAASINAVAFILFIFSGKIVWELALLMLTGGIIGGYVGARLALKVSSNHLRKWIIGFAWVMTVMFFVT